MSCKISTEGLKPPTPCELLSSLLNMFHSNSLITLKGEHVIHYHRLPQKCSAAVQRAGPWVGRQEPAQQQKLLKPISHTRGRGQNRGGRALNGMEEGRTGTRDRTSEQIRPGIWYAKSNPPSQAWSICMEQLDLHRQYCWCSSKFTCGYWGLL